MALPPRPRPGSRLRLRPRKAGASGRGRLAPPPLPSGFPSHPPSLGPYSAESSVLCGRRRTLLRARPPPDSSPGSRGARPRRLVSPGPRDAGPAAPAPPPPRALALARGPGTRGQRTVGPPTAPAFATPPSRLARAPVGTSGSFAVSRVLATVPRPSLTLVAPALFLCRIPPESQKQLGPRRRKKGNGKSRKGGGGAR